MSRFFKLLGILGATLAGLVLVVLVVVLSISDERYRQWTIEAVESATDRSFSMDEFSFDVGKVTAVEAGGLRLGNAAWAKHEEMLRIDRVEVLVRPFELIRGRPGIEARIEGAALNFERTNSDEANWRMAGEFVEHDDRSADEDRGFPAIALVRELAVRNARVTLEDAISGTVRTLTIDTLGMRAGETIDVDFDGRAQEVPLALSGTLGHVNRLAAARSTTLELAGTAGDATLDITGTWSPMLEQPAADLRVELDMPSDMAVVALTGLEKGAVESGRIEAHFVAGEGNYALPTLDARLNGERVAGTVSGVVGRLSPPGDIDLAVDARVSGPADLLRQLGVNVDAALPTEIALHGRLSGDGETIRASDVTVTTGEEGLSASASGTITFTSAAIPDLDIAFDAGAPSSNALAPYAGVKIPDLGALRASGRVVSTNETFGVEALVVELDGRGIDARVEGSIAGLAGLAGTELRATAKLDDLGDGTVGAIQAFANEFGVNIPPAALAAHAVVEGRLQGDLENMQVPELTAAVRDDGVAIEFAGNIVDLLGEPTVEAKASADVDSLAVLERYTDNELPATGPLSLRASLGGGAGNGTPFRLDLATGAIETIVEGNLGDVRSLEEMALNFSTTADSLADFSALAQRELPANGPFLLAGRFEASGGAYRLSDFTLKIDNQEATGSLTVTPGAGSSVGTVDGRLTIGRLDLGPLVGLSDEDAPARASAEADADAAPATTAETEGAEQRIFSADPLPFDLLRQYQGNVSITAEHMTLGKSNLTNLETVVRLENGRLAVEPLTSAVDNGALTGSANIDVSGARPSVAIFLDMKGAAMPRLGGSLELGLDVRGEGNSIAEIMGETDGEVLVVVTGARIAKSLLTSFGTDLLNSLNPLSKSKDFSTIECGILRAEITDGIASFDDRLAAQMTETTWRGGGELNLKTEELDVGIVPRARKGLGISAGSLASLVQVTGTLARPSVRPDPTGLAKNYGRYVAAVSTGGLSLLAEGLRDRFKANADVCAEIREGTVFEMPANGTAQKTEE